MFNKRKTLSAAIHLACSGVVATGIALSGIAGAEEEAVKLQKEEVTGSHIKRVDIEGALPVTVITREQIDMSGEISVADVLRATPFNSFGSFRPQSGSSAQGTSSLNLRGLGSDRTLILVDGRRLPKSPSTGSDQDLNVIPLGAVERIEILTDGASAIYGSDALGGVVNIITRQDYEGAEFRYGKAGVSIPDEGGDREEGSVLFGAASGSSSILGGISYNKRDIIFARDFPWNQPGASVFGNSFTTLDAAGNDNFDWFYTGACDFPGTGFFVLGSRCAYDYTLVSADEASTSNKSLWLKAKHDINADWQVWMNSSYTETESFGRYAPVPDSSFYTGIPLTANSPNNPTNPASPLYDPSLGLPQQDLNWWHRFDALGNRDSEVVNKLVDLQIGITGMIGDVEVDAGLRRTTNRSDDIGRNFLLRSRAAEVIESGLYDLSNPYGVSDEVLNSMKVTISRISKYDQNEFWASAAFDLFEISGGMAQAFVGAEYREEFYDDQYDSLSEAGQVGGSSGNSAGGDRSVRALYFETLFPVIDDVEVTVAGRFDDYSDYGNDFSPKISGRWQATDELMVRASYGQGFRAPSLDIITQKDSFSADPVRDPQSCINQGQPENCSLQINGTRTANPELDSENSDQFAFGVAYEPTDWVNLSVDYYNIEITDRIKFFGAQTLVDAELAGDPIPAGLGVVRAPNGSILSITQGYGNEGDLATSGIDLNVRFQYDLFGGQVTNDLKWSHVLDYSVDGGRDMVKDPGAPADRAVLANVFEINDFSFGWNINYIGSQYDDIIDGKGVGHVPSWVTHDVQANYHAKWDGKFTIGVRNVTEKYPPIGVGLLDGRDYDFNLYDGYGRIFYARYTQTF
ncbi:TonB-dependent receptor plug domain-containing protein [Thiolapillus sp.]